MRWRLIVFCLAIGEFWANTLYNVYADLVGERGFGQNAMTQTDSLDGNVVFMHNMIDGLLLQPCNPTSAFWIFSFSNKG